jgi:hypothetical protein
MLIRSPLCIPWINHTPFHYLLIIYHNISPHSPAS